MPDHLIFIRICRYNFDLFATLQNENTSIGRLTTTARIEARLIQGDVSFLNRNDRRLRFEAMVIL